MKLKSIATVLCSVFFSFSAFCHESCPEKENTLCFVSENASAVGHINFSKLFSNEGVITLIKSFQQMDPRAERDLTNIRNKFQENNMVFENAVSQVTFVASEEKTDYALVELNYPHEKIFSIFKDEPGAENVLTSQTVNGLNYYYFVDQFCIHFINERVAVACSSPDDLSAVIASAKNSDFSKNKKLAQQYKKVAGKVAWLIVNETDSTSENGGQQGFASIGCNENDNFSVLFDFVCDKEAMKQFRSQYMAYTMIANSFLMNEQNSKTSKEFLKPLVVNFNNKSISGSFNFKIKDLITLSEDMKKMQNMMKKASKPASSNQIEIAK